MANPRTILPGFENEGNDFSDGCVASSMDVERLPSHCFSPLVIKKCLSSLFGVFFARKMHSTSEFAMTVLSKCVFHAGFVKVA